MTLNHAIEQANRDGRLGLIIYTIPRFPSRRVHDEVVRMLDGNPAVSVVETTIPVTGQFSPHANRVIRHAHRVATVHGETFLTGRRRRRIKPRLYVIYRQTVARLGFDQLLRRLRGRADGLLLEWNERRKNAQYAEACRMAGIELVQCVGPWMTGGEIGSLMALTDPRPLVYLMSAARTGGALFASSELACCAELVRRHRPAARIAAGFGIATPDHVRAIANVPGVDAVIVGTAFLKAMSRGSKSAEQYLATITGSLTRSPRT